MDVHELRREAKRIRDGEKPDLDAARRMLDAASESGGQPEMVVASLVMMRHRGKLREDDWPRVGRWAQGIESREAADLFAQYVVAPLFERAPHDEQLSRWTKSAEPLLRRLAARSAMHVDGLDALAPLARDEDELVQEAVADALREKAKRDEPAVYEFLREHPEAPRSMVRRAAAALSSEHALALTTGRLPPRPPRDDPRREPEPKRARSKAPSKAERERLGKAQRALGDALEAREDARRALEKAEAEVEAAKGRLDEAERRRGGARD